MENQSSGERSCPNQCNDNLVLQKIPCTKKQNKLYQQMIKQGKALPYNVFGYTDSDGSASETHFFTVHRVSSDDMERWELLERQRLAMKSTITLYLVFMAAAVLVGVALFMILMASR